MPLQKLASVFPVALPSALALAWVGLLVGLPAASDDAAESPRASDFPLYVKYSAEDRASMGGLSQIGEQGGAPLYRRELLSPTFTIDRIYKSMLGPVSRVLFTVDPSARTPELLWVTAFRSEITQADGQTPASDEFMCHAQLHLNGGDYKDHFGSALKVAGNRLFSLDQGTPVTKLPDGFGVPLMSDHELMFNPQVLNHNMVDKTLQVRIKVSIEFVRDRDLAKSLIPLVQHGVYGMVLVAGEDGYVGLAPGVGNEEEHGPGCSIAETAALAKAGKERPKDPYGRQFSAFWVVEPGKHVYRTRVTSLLDLPYDTTLHYAAAHLHPFAESLELRDLTTGDSIIKSRARQADQGIGLAEVETITDETGIPLYRDHEYELVSVYNNTSGEEQDAMSTMLLYLHAVDMKKALARLPGASAATH